MKLNIIKKECNMYEKVRFTLNAKIGVNFENGNLKSIDSVVYDWLKQKELSITEIIDLLNNFDKERIKLKLELNTHKHPLWSTREAERVVNELRNENEELKERINELDEECTKLCNFNLHNILDNKNKEIEQLKSTLAFRSNQLALMEFLIDDLGSEEMKRQMMGILKKSHISEFKE